MTDLIERCAIVADEAVLELEAILRSPQARNSQYDRQTPIKIRFTIRWMKRVADRIRALNPRPEEDVQAVLDPRYKQAQELLKELRPMIAQSVNSNWRTVMLKKIDDLCAPPGDRSVSPD